MYSTLLFLKGECIDNYCNVIVEAIICCYLHHGWLVRRGIVVIYSTLLFGEESICYLQYVDVVKAILCCHLQHFVVSEGRICCYLLYFDDRCDTLLLFTILLFSEARTYCY